MMLLCVMLRWSIAMVPPVADLAAHDKCFRYGTRVALSPSACHYLRTETWVPAHPRTRCFKRKGECTARELRR